MASVEYGHGQTTSGHLLAALLLDDNLRRYINLAPLLDIPAESLREAVRQVVGSTGESGTATAEATEATASNAYKPSKTPSLDQFTVNLTEAARNGRIDPVLGRDGEIRQIIDILTRRRQNNPILTGEAGVGKTAVVEGFALRIATGDVPEPLQNVAVRTLDLGLLQAGASVKGEFENRLKSVINEVKSSPQPIIMFIDEAHTMIGAGGQAGQGDAANLLKPALARGELHCVGATTLDEYRKYIEKDAALERRFQKVLVEEPNVEDTIAILRGLKERYEVHHGVEITDPAIVAAYYTELQRETLTVRPGLASPGSIYNYTHGEKLLEEGSAEEAYVQRLLPVKLALDLVYVREQSFAYDLAIVWRTVITIASILVGVEAFPEPSELQRARSVYGFV